MRNSTNVNMDAVIYRGPDDCCEIEVEVEGHAIPFWPGNFNNPPEGGYVEDLVAYFQDGKKRREIPLTDDEVEKFSEQLMEQDLDDEPDEDYDD